MNWIELMWDIEKKVKLRFAELDEYIEFIKFLESWIVQYKSTSVISHIINIQKSTIFLMMYNVLEYAVYAGIYNLYGTIWKKNFNKLNISVQEKIIWDFLSIKEFMTSSNIVQWINKLEIDVNMLGVSKRKDNHKPIVSWAKGSIDINIINTILKTYWIEVLTPINHGDFLKVNEIKNIRNNLAHWTIAFSELKQYSVDEIKSISVILWSIISEYLLRIKQYKKNKLYLKKYSDINI